MEAKREFMCKERIVDLEFKISRLGILGKAYYELAQVKLKRHRTLISIARTQNTLLHAALSTLREKDRIARKNASDLENLRKTTASLRVIYDDHRQLVFRKQRKLELQITGTHSAELECAGVLDPSTPPEVRIRSLEHKLAWIRAKIKDLQILVRQYEQTVQPLRDEWIVYDAKLAALQGHVTMKNQECELLINTYHDAVRARDAAKLELEELLAFVFGYGKKNLIPPELQSKILKAIKEIKSVMNVGSMREMYHQFLLQEKQTAYLDSIYEEMLRLIERIKDDSLFTRKKSSMMQNHEVSTMVEGTKVMVRRRSSIRGAFPLLQILEGTQKLVDKIHEGHFTLLDPSSVERRVLETCREKLVQLLKALHRKLRKRNREAAKKVEFEASQAAHWKREEAEVARRHKAAEEARQKYDERNAAREALQNEAQKEARQQEAKLEAQLKTKEAGKDGDQEPRSLTDNLTMEVAPLSVEDSTSCGNDYMISSCDQLAKDAAEQRAATEISSVIFLPNFQQALDATGATERESERGPEGTLGHTAAAQPSYEKESPRSEVESHTLGTQTTSDMTTGKKPIMLSTNESQVERPLESGQPIFLDQSHDENEPPRPVDYVPSLTSNEKPVANQVESTLPTSPLLSGGVAPRQMEIQPPSIEGLPIDVNMPFRLDAILAPGVAMASDARTGACQPMTVSGSTEESVEQRQPDAGPHSLGVLSSAESIAPRESIPTIATVLYTKSTTVPASTRRVVEGSRTESSTARLAEPAAPKIEPASSLERSAAGPAKTVDPKMEGLSSLESLAGDPAVAVGPGVAIPIERAPTQPTGGETMVVVLSSEVNLEAEKPKEETSAEIGQTRPAKRASPMVVALSSAECSSAKLFDGTSVQGAQPRPAAAGLSIVVPLSSEASAKPKAEKETSAGSAPSIPAEGSPVVLGLSTEGLTTKPTEATGLLRVAAPFDDDAASSHGDYGKPTTISPSPHATASQRPADAAPARQADNQLPISLVPSSDMRTPVSHGEGHDQIVVAVSSEDHPEQGETKLTDPATLPRSPGGIPVAPRAEVSLVEAESREDILLQSPQEVAQPRSPNLPRSPSGAPIGSGARMPPVDIVSKDESLTPRSPKLPRSPSGAPMSTAAKFPLEALSVDETTAQRSAGASVPIASAPPRALRVTPVVAGAGVPTEGQVLIDDSIMQRPAGTELPSTPSEPLVAIETRLSAVTAISPEEKDSPKPA